MAEPVPPPATYVPLPAGLTAPCIHEAAPATNGELLEAYADARTTIAACDARLAEIRRLQP